MGGDRCAAIGVAMSFPILLSSSLNAGGSNGLRGQFFYNIGNVWNHTTRTLGSFNAFGNAEIISLSLDLKKVYNTAKDSYGMGIMIPFGNVGRLEINYCFSQKRFSFLFCAM